MLSFIFSVALSGCSKDEDGTKNPINEFSMSLDGRTWKPSVLGDCQSSFYAAVTYFTYKTGETSSSYLMKANRYSDETNTVTESDFEVVVSDVIELGNYELDGSYKDLTSSYAVYKKNTASGLKIYINSSDSPFIVNIKNFLPVKNSEMLGIQGTFEGTLQNEKDPSDKMIIQKGNFTFKKINWYDFNQCE
jgi:hypothetical protein